MLINRNSQDCSRSCILACEVLLSHPMTLRISSCQSSRPWACRGPRNLAIVSKRGCWSRWYQASAYAFAAMEVDNPLVPAYCTAGWPQCIHLCREALASTCRLLCKARGGHSRAKTESHARFQAHRRASRNSIKYCCTCCHRDCSHVEHSETWRLNNGNEGFLLALLAAF